MITLVDTRPLVTTSWTGKKAIITGINGLIGAWLASKLIEEGAIVTGIDTSPKGMLQLHPNTKSVHVYTEDIRNLEAMQLWLQGNDVIFHLAAISGVEHSRQLAHEAIDINVRGTYSVLEAARRLRTPVLVATSNHIYGKQATFPVKESAPLNQLDTYSASKVCSDVLTRAYYHNYGLTTSAVRNTNCFGPYDPHNDHIIMSTIRSILSKEKPIIKSNGLTIKSYMHVEDTALSYMKIAELMIEHPGEAWNVSDERIGVQELVALICDTMGWKEGYHVLGEGNDQSDEYMDSSKLRSYGWMPKWTLKEAIRDTVKWVKS